MQLSCFVSQKKANLTDIHKTDSDSQPSWDYLTVLGAWVWAESPVCHRVHLCSQQQQHSWARLSSSSLLPPLMDSVWINSFHHWYYALGAYLQTLMGKHWYRLLGEWREVLGSSKHWRRERVLPVCSLSAQSSNALGMHKLLLCWPSTAGQREVQIKHHMNCEYAVSTVPQILVRDLRAWDSHTNPGSSGRSSQCSLQEAGLAHVTHSKEGKIWIISDIRGHCSNNPSLH